MAHLALKGNGATAHVDGCDCVRCRGFEPGNTIGPRFQLGNQANLRSGAYVADARLSVRPSHG